MKPKYKYTGAIIGILAITSTILFFSYFKFFKKEISKSGVFNYPAQNVFDDFSNLSKENKTNANKNEVVAENNATQTGGTGEVLPRYYSPDYNFFFDVPKGFSFTEISDGGGDIVLAEDRDGESFQVFIIPFDEIGPLTPERIKKDIPQKIIQNVRFATLDGARAVVFLSREESIGDVFEIWFIYGGSLYQITTKAEYADELQNILQTWRFY